MKSHHVGQSVDRLMRVSGGKRVWVISDNYQPHRSIAVEYENKYRGRLYLMFLPPYSPALNLQENIWAWLNDYCSRTSAYSTVKEPHERVRKFHIYAYSTPSKVRRRVNACNSFEAA